jgi:threonine synthase
MALQILPFLLACSAKAVLSGKTVEILVATSGDTGKAALEGFKNIDGTKITVFYPENGVSEMQKLQMSTQEGENVSVCAIKGNFDDAQTGVKQIFANNEFSNWLNQKNTVLSSANSINWGRLVPQIVYYFWGYAQMVKKGQVEFGLPIDIAVPTGNFGNILAAFYAKKMGLPVERLICASNSNNVLTDFLKTGVYDRNREFFATISPSMDILVSSNLERLLFELSGHNDTLVKALMEELSQKGSYTVSGELFSKISPLFKAGFVSEPETKAEIKKIFDDFHYLSDTHTAVGLKVAFTEKSKNAMLIASTASPYKFPASVLCALGESVPESEFDAAEKLAETTQTAIPHSLLELKEKRVRFTGSIEKEQMQQFICDSI